MEEELKKIREENEMLTLELSGYRLAILNDKEMLGLKEQNEKLKERISKAQDFIRNESYLNDSEIDELCEILEGDK